MQFTRLGSSGLTVSRLCLGTMNYGPKSARAWAVDEEVARPIFRKAFDLGFNFFDTADVYTDGASEEITGRALRDFGKRETYVLATKVFGVTGSDPNQRGLSRKHIMHGIDNSLRRLGVDYVDLYQIHRFDPDTPIEETLEALSDVVKAGKALYIGASSMASWQFAQMLALSDAKGYRRFVSMQNHYNLIYREEEREMIPLCRKEGIGLLPYSPLGRGVLSRPSALVETTARSKTDAASKSLYRRGDDDTAVVDAVTAVARNRGVPQAQVAIAWLLAQPGVTAPIVGASSVSHLEDAAKALEIKLDESELKVLAEPYRLHPVLGH